MIFWAIKCNKVEDQTSRFSPPGNGEVLEHQRNVSVIMSRASSLPCVRWTTMCWFVVWGKSATLAQGGCDKADTYQILSACVTICDNEFLDLFDMAKAHFKLIKEITYLKFVDRRRQIVTAVESEGRLDCLSWAFSLRNHRTGQQWKNVWAGPVVSLTDCFDPPGGRPKTIFDHLSSQFFFNFVHLFSWNFRLLVPKNQQFELHQLRKQPPPPSQKKVGRWRPWSRASPSVASSSKMRSNVPCKAETKKWQNVKSFESKVTWKKNEKISCTSTKKRYDIYMKFWKVICVFWIVFLQKGVQICVKNIKHKNICVAHFSFEHVVSIESEISKSISVPGFGIIIIDIMHCVETHMLQIHAKILDMYLLSFGLWKTINRFSAGVFLIWFESASLSDKLLGYALLDMGASTAFAVELAASISALVDLGFGSVCPQPRRCLYPSLWRCKPLQQLGMSQQPGYEISWSLGSPWLGVASLVSTLKADMSTTGHQRLVPAVQAVMTLNGHWIFRWVARRHEPKVEILSGFQESDVRINPWMIGKNYDNTW